ncbi:hypothetical protein PR048_001994 [Dryococelus australis]|uniref:DNA helicase Pif1-like 2B domain-containing protein n=1 Tax=Dryococelus australis TaxID=614101 RepID=A0ABQ9IKE7_9NEOP|nr:hypothetical protein PR048_001994 [Dryococelus australis]
MRVNQGQEEFQQFLLHIGEGTCPPIPCLPEGYIELPDFLVLPENVDICSHVFGYEVISTRAILCPWNEDVDYINIIMVARLSGDHRTSLPHDQLEDTSKDSRNAPIQFLNPITLSLLLPNSLTLAVGLYIMLIRNLDTYVMEPEWYSSILATMRSMLRSSLAPTNVRGPTFQGLSCCLLRLTSPFPSVGESFLSILHLP